MPFNENAFSVRWPTRGLHFQFARKCLRKIIQLQADRPLALLVEPSSLMRMKGARF